MHTSKLNHTNLQQAEQIWRLFRSAYEIEAQLLDLQDFPPLNRTVVQIKDSHTTFFGGWHDSTFVCAIEIEGMGTEQIHISSLGVAPDHFQQGFGTKLLNDVLANLSWQRVTVSTAVHNLPALHLYKKHGFHTQEQWTTPENIKMVTLYKEATY